MSLRDLILGPSAETRSKHPECFNHSTSDPSLRTRTTPMQVLCLSMPRTGTASMYAALTILGYDCYHGYRAFADIRDYELWNPAYETKFHNNPSNICPKVDRQFFDVVLGHMSAVADFPPAAFATELIEAYPEAKVVLVERGEEAWMRSFENVFVATYASTFLRVLAKVEPWVVGPLIQANVRGVAEGMFRARCVEEFRRNAIPVYRAHNEEVRRVLRERGEEERLLEYRLGEGWDQLCSLLEKEVPRVEFPKINESKMTQEKIAVMVIVGARKAVARILMVGVIVAMIGLLRWYVTA